MLNWDLIEECAKRIGVPYGTYKKWRHRNNVPHKWRYQITIASGGIIGITDFLNNDVKNGRQI